MTKRQQTKVANQSYDRLFRTNTKPIFNQVVITSEHYTRVLMNGEWGWIDNKGNFTSEKSEASFGSWYDLDK